MPQVIAENAVPAPPGEGVAESRAREHYLRVALRDLPGALWATDRELRIVYAQGRVLALSELDAGEVKGMTVSEFVGTIETGESVEARHRAALRGHRQAFRYDFRGRLFEVSIDPMRDERGAIVGCLGAALDVTDRRIVEEELQRSRSQLEEAQRVGHVGSFVYDLTSGAVSWSAQMHRIYGVPQGGFDGTIEGYLAHVHPDDLEPTKEMIAAAIDAGGPFEAEHRIVRDDGSVRVLKSRGELVEGAGEKLRLVGSAWDVTELAEATERLRRAASLHRATIEATADGLLVIDTDGRVVTFNTQFMNLWRIPTELVEAGDDAAVLAIVLDQLQEPEAFLARVHELYRHPEAESFDVLRFRDGRVFERVSRPQRLGDEIVGRVWSFRDVTERENALRRVTLLSEASRLLTSLEVESALEGVARLVVPYLADVCAIDLLEGARRFVASAEGCELSVPLELPPTVLTGQVVRFTSEHRACISVPLVTRASVVGAITLMGAESRRYAAHDLELTGELARRAALALENARLYHAARDALAAREELLAVAAHELRGPLTSIHFAAQTLRLENLPAGQRDRILDVLEREDRRLARFVDELLDLGRIQGGLQLAIEEVDLAELVQEVVERSGPELVRSGSTVSVTREKDTTGHWDRFRLEQVVTNLLGNAIKFGLGKPIDVSVRSEGTHVVLEVRDRGIGVAPGMHEQIFRPFERGVSPRHYGGLGLGLHIVRTIVEELGGRVRAESAPDEGTSFVVELPREPRSKQS